MTDRPKPEQDWTELPPWEADGEFLVYWLQHHPITLVVVVVSLLIGGHGVVTLVGDIFT